MLRHGRGSLVNLFDLRRLRLGRHGSPPSAGHSGPAHLRRALEELGPTFIKLGQVLSTRPDLVPPRYEAELSLLQDSGPIVATRDIVAAIEAAFGRPISAMFDRFDDVAIAAASIGQVHAATLRDGSDVVVKVCRPGVVEQVMVDLELLNRLAATARATFVARAPLRPGRTRPRVRRYVARRARLSAARAAMPSWSRLPSRTTNASISRPYSGTSPAKG